MTMVFRNITENKLCKELKKYFDQLDALSKKSADHENADVIRKLDSKSNGVELEFEACGFSERALLLLTAGLKRHPSITTLTFKECVFNEKGTSSLYLRDESVPHLGYLGIALADTQIKKFNFHDPSEITSAQATIAFAQGLAKNTVMTELTYDTGTRGTCALVLAVAKMQQLLCFENPLLSSIKSGYRSSPEARDKMFNEYFRAKRLLEHRQSILRFTEKHPNPSKHAVSGNDVHGMPPLILSGSFDDRSTSHRSTSQESAARGSLNSRVQATSFKA